MLKIKQELFINEKIVWDDNLCYFNTKKRKYNQPKKLGEGGKVPSGAGKYNLIIQRPVDVIYPSGRIARETRVINWKTLSRYIRDRDKKCLKCGSTKKLQADHFHPLCYHWVSWFFRASKIQTLCEDCHNSMPPMGAERQKNWKKYVYLKQEGTGE